MKSQVRRWDDLRWQELTWTQFKWDELRRNENSWNETRRGEKSWDAWRKKLAQWGMLNKNEKKWEKMRTDEKELRCGAEMKRTVSEMKTADKRREQLRWTEKKWENMRWGHMKFVFNCTCIDAAVKASYVTSWRGSVGWNHSDSVSWWTNPTLWWRCVLLQVATPEPFSRNIRHAPDATWQKYSCNFQPVFPVTVKMLPKIFQHVLHANFLVFPTNF